MSITCTLQSLDCLSYYHHLEGRIGQFLASIPTNFHYTLKPIIFGTMQNIKIIGKIEKNFVEKSQNFITCKVDFFYLLKLSTNILKFKFLK